MAIILNNEIRFSDNDRPPLILIHGVAGSLHIWDPVFDELARDRTVVRMDLLGYGHSPKPRTKYTPSEHAAAIKATLTASGVNPPYVLVGLSMGVTLALAYAEAYADDVDSLIAVGYPYYPDRASAVRGLRHNLWAGLTIRHPVFSRFFIPTAWWLGRIGVLQARSFAGIYSELQARETLLNPYRVFRANIWHSMVDVDARRLIGASAEKRRLFLHGADDEWSPAEDVRRALLAYPDTTFTQVPAAGHNLVVLRPTAVTRAIRSFLENA